MSEIVTYFIGAACWFCGLAFITVLILLWKVAESVFKIILLGLTFCAFTLGLSFLTNFNYELVQWLTFVSTVSLSAFFARTGYFILLRFNNRESFVLDESYRDALVTIGLFTAVGRTLKKRDILDRLKQPGTTLLSYSFLKQTKIGEAIPLSEDGESYMIRQKCNTGILLNVFLKKGCEFDPHFHDCWEFLKVFKGSFVFPSKDLTVYAEEQITIRPQRKHFPYAPEDCELKSLLINDTKWNLLLYRLFGPRL